MYPVSEQFLRTLTTAHSIVTQVDVLYDGATVAEDISFTDGAVSVDAGSDIRRSLTLTIPDPRDFPFAADAPYAPYGQQLFVQSGLRHLDGSVELVPLGFFVIETISGDVHEGPLSITAQGLESLVMAEPLTAPTSTVGYPDTAEFCGALISAAVPGASFVDLSTLGDTDLPTKTWDSDSDRWAALQEAARAIGAEIFCSAAGTFTLRDVPDMESLPISWSVSAGEGGVLVSAQRELTSDGVYNRIIVRGGNAADDVPPVAATAVLDDTSDPRHYGGPFGQRTRVIVSDLVVNTTQAEIAAEAALRNAIAPNSSVTLSAVPNPALDAGDCIRVVYGSGLHPELHLVRSFTVPLGAGGDFTIETVSGKAEE